MKKKKTAEQQILDAVAPGLHKKLVEKRAKQQAAIKWDLGPGEADLISKIVKRAMERFPKHNLDKMTLLMDLTAAHANGTTLQLKELLEADDFNFGHDIFGISNHIDRNTGKMTRCFLPRFYAYKKVRG